MTTHALAATLISHAAGLTCDTAAAELISAHGTWLARADFTAACIHAGTRHDGRRWTECRRFLRWSWRCGRVRAGWFARLRRRLGGQAGRGCSGRDRGRLRRLGDCQQGSVQAA